MSYLDYWHEVKSQQPSCVHEVNNTQLGDVKVKESDSMMTSLKCQIINQIKCTTNNYRNHRHILIYVPKICTIIFCDFCLCVFVPYMCSTCRGQKKVSVFLELESQTAVNCLVGVKTQTQVIYKNNR